MISSVTVELYQLFSYSWNCNQVTNGKEKGLWDLNGVLGMVIVTLRWKIDAYHLVSFPGHLVSSHILEYVGRSCLHGVLLPLPRCSTRWGGACDTGKRQTDRGENFRSPVLNEKKHMGRRSSLQPKIILIYKQLIYLFGYVKSLFIRLILYTPS